MKLLLIFTHLFILIAQGYSKEELNLYSARQEVLMRPLIELFEDEYKNRPLVSLWALPTRP